MSVTVQENVTVKMANALLPSVFDSASVAENIGRNLHCFINPLGAAPAALKLWSKLESVGDVTSPQIGTGGSEIGSPTYVASKFNNGILSDVNGEGCKFPTFDNDINLDKGTIEYWGKMKFDEAHADYHYLWTFVDDNNGGIRLYFNPSFDDFLVQVYSGGSLIFTISTEGMSWSVDDLLHFAVTWDREGNDIGSSKTIALYIDDVEVASSTTTWSADTVLASLVIGLHEGEAALHSDVVADNLKAYNEVRLDFSDKDTESPLLPGEGISVAESIESVASLANINIFDAIGVTDIGAVEVLTLFNLAVNDATSVADVLTSRLLSRVSVFDAISVVEYLAFSGKLGDVSVLDTVAVAEAVVMNLLNLISVNDSVSISEAVSALAVIAGISVYDVVKIFESVNLEWWLGISKDDTVWSDVSKGDTVWSNITKPDTEWSDVR